MPTGVELAAYTDAAGEERVWHVFSGAQSADVEAGWEDRWRTFHRPVRVGRLWVGPPWEAPPADLLGVVIDPGRAFGTGAHPTTQLCLELLQELPVGVAARRRLRIRRSRGGGCAARAYGPCSASTSRPRRSRRHARTRRGTGSRSRRVSSSPAERLPGADAAVANISIDAVNGAPGAARRRLLVTSGYLASERAGPARLHARGAP